MRIAGIAVYQVHLPYAGGTYRLSGGRVYTGFDACVVGITTEDGRTGWGESTPFGGTYIAAHAGGIVPALAELAPPLIGQDPRAHDRRQEMFDAHLLGHNHARTALDVACWDLAAQGAGLPLADALGGRVAAPVPVISSIGSDTPEGMRANVAAHRAKGFRGHSIKIGAAEAEGGPALDAERIAACLADRQPGEWFLADANNGMRAEEVLRMQELLPAGSDIVLEAPCASWAETRAVRARCRLPILLDELIQTEADLITAIRDDLCDGVGLKISKQGGITPTLHQRSIARAAGLVMSVQDTTGAEIAFAALLAVAQSTPRHLLRCALDSRAMVTQSIAAYDAPITDGGVTAPITPGLGVTPHMDVLGDPVAEYGTGAP